MYYMNIKHKHFKDAPNIDKMMMGIITVKMPFKCII